MATKKYEFWTRAVDHILTCSNLTCRRCKRYHAIMESKRRPTTKRYRSDYMPHVASVPYYSNRKSALD